MAPKLAVYASYKVNRFTPAQDSLPGVGQTLLDGLSTRRVPTKGFSSASYIASSFPKLRLARSLSLLIVGTYLAVESPLRVSGARLTSPGLACWFFSFVFRLLV